MTRTQLQIRRAIQVAAGAAFLLAACADGFGRSVNVRDFGAKADKTTNDAQAIQTAVNACSQSGGGRVIVPAGDYLTGRIQLKSNVTLVIEAGATIWASANARDYEEQPKPEGKGFLIVAEGQENIGIVGEGKIQGCGAADLDRRADPEQEGRRPTYRFSIIHFSNCTAVRLRDIRILNSEAHTVILTRCQQVTIDTIEIINNFWRVNTDGIDAVSCTNVFISNCHIVAGDDCICPKTEGGAPLENLVVNNCILESVSAAVKLGTGSSGDFRDIKVSNCVIRNSGVGLGIFIKDGGAAERISFDHISIETTRQDTPINTRLRNNIIPIYIDIEKRRDDSPAGAVRDVSFSNIQIASDSGVLIQGMPESAIENLTLRNLSFRVTQGFDFSARKKRAGGTSNPNDDRITRFIRQPAYLALAHINGLVLEGIRVISPADVFQQFDRAAVAVFESRNATIRNVQRQPPGNVGGQPVIALNNCEDSFVTDCFALPGTPFFLGLAGEKTRNISLTGNDLSQAASPVSGSKEVRRDAWKEVRAAGIPQPSPASVLPEKGAVAR